MASEILKADQNRVRVLAGVTDNEAQEIVMLRVDPTTKRLKISGMIDPGSGVGDVSSNTALSVDDELVLFSGLTGKLVKRATISGLAKVTSGVLSAAVAGTDYVIPSGSVATLTTPRAIYGNNFNGSAALAQIIASTYGGTGNGFTKFTGATTTEKTYTLPDANATILTTAAVVTVAQGGTGAATLTGLLKGNGTSAFTAAVAGTDYVAIGGVLGTPSSGTLTNCTGLPAAGLVTSTSTAVGFGTIELGHASDTTLSRSAAGVLAVEGVTVTTDGSTTETSSATTTIAIAGTRHTHTITALAAADAIAAPTSTITLSDKNTLLIRIKDNGTARALTWNAIFRAIGVTLPTTTVINKTLYIGCKYNVADTKWDILAVGQEA